MMSYGQLFLAVAPVIALIGLGLPLRRMNWISEAGEETLLNLIVRVLTPCLIFESVVRRASVSGAGDVLLPPLMGFLLTSFSLGVGWYVARALGLTIGHGLRTFALAVGLTNYGYLPLPLMDTLFGPESRAWLFMHNAGVEAAIWTTGVLIVTGESPRAAWRKLLNAPLLALAVALVVKLTGAGVYIPEVVWTFVHALAVCAVPLGLLMTGASFAPHLNDPKQLANPRIILTAWLVRLAVLPWVFLLAARYLPVTTELKQVLVVQAAMPAAVISVIVARIYGGRPLIAVQIILGTTALAVFTIPAWIKFGLAFAGLAP
ncbi:Membrane transport protein [Lacunisphaera limnophila]|uniref:Membrane transport protein n=1 Tax=Lacunisphaera limnophila TaxID=1838286 RepID=A0A1D8AU53_9BACT|nr:AEC family transporter [Lacunisphaera limnophila]AOS44413.1 Membrane transport protein [Lacunisphaera limnophila]